MMGTWAFVLATVLSFLVALYGTPIARAAAMRFGVVDHPDGKLKTHPDPIPYFGGLAIYLAVLIPLCLFYQFEKSILAILLAGTLVLILGLIDDFGVLTPAAKFIGQFIAAVVLVKGDILIRVQAFHPYVNLFLTLLWVIGMTNAMNIIDIMDGLAAGVALISAMFLSVISLLNGHNMIAIFSLTLVGSLAGFLPYNFYPAKIYMGDAGAMFLGLTLGTLAILGDYTAQNKLAYLNPILFFGVAIFDTMYVMLLRAIKGRSMFLGSKDHFAVRLKLAGWSVARIVIYAYLAAALLGGVALVNMYLPSQTSIILYCILSFLIVLLGWRLAKIKVT
jgi:UDP-GlcNAc:undecaprenyl-phosphate/decaprenyl-phosphate GlcNAc-1-phosphate transferase